MIGKDVVAATIRPRGLIDLDINIPYSASDFETRTGVRDAVYLGDRDNHRCVHTSLYDDICGLLTCRGNQR